MAFLPERDTEDVLKRQLAQFGVSRAAFDREIQEIRSKGYSITEESLLPGILAIGCPVFGRDGRVVAAISVVGILGYLDPSEESPVVTVLKQECQKLSDTFDVAREASAIPSVISAIAILFVQQRYAHMDTSVASDGVLTHISS